MGKYKVHESNILGFGFFQILPIVVKHWTVHSSMFNDLQLRCKSGPETQMPMVLINTLVFKS